MTQADQNIAYQATQVQRGLLKEARKQTRINMFTWLVSLVALIVQYLRSLKRIRNKKPPWKGGIRGSYQSSVLIPGGEVVNYLAR